MMVTDNQTIINDQIDVLTKQIEQLQNEINALQSNSVTITEFNELQNKVNTLQTESATKTQFDQLSKNITLLQNTMVTNDQLQELIKLIRALQANVDTLESAVATLDTKVQKLNYLSKLLEVTVTNLTFGDILQYNSDGKWHNIQPNKIISSGSSGSSVYKLADLEDVEISMPTNKQTIVYSSLDNKWHNDSISGGGSIDPGILDDYLTKVEAKNTYFPISGGTINGDVQIKGNLLTTGGITIHSTVL